MQATPQAALTRKPVARPLLPRRQHPLLPRRQHPLLPLQHWGRVSFKRQSPSPTATFRTMTPWHPLFRRRAPRHRSRASSGVAAPVEGVVGCGGAGRGRRPPLWGAPLRGAPRTPCWRPRQATAACRAAAVAAQPACAARLANRPRVCSTSWSGLRAKTTLKFLRFPGDADPMSIGLNSGKTEEAPRTRARARVPAISSFPEKKISWAELFPTTHWRFF